jgi:electron transfer flavoprotein beta subunit
MKDGSALPYAELYEQRPYLNLVEWTAADVNADLEQCGLNGSPTKVKTVQNIVFQAKESQTLTSSDADVEGLVKELLDKKIIG